MVDLTVAAIPAFFGTMAAEHLYLKRTATPGRPRAGEYERRDTLASLTMGTASLVVPPLMRRALRPVTPGKGRWGRALVLGTIGAAAVTTAADVVARRLSGPLPEAGTLPASPSTGPAATGSETTTGSAATGSATTGSAATGTTTGSAGSTASSPEDGTSGLSRARRRLLARRARRVASSAGVTAVAAGVTAGALAWGSRTAAEAVWARSGHKRDLGTGALVTLGAILGWDLIYYWNHRLMHESRHMWAMHVVHHSSEHYNLSTALRQPVADTFTIGVPMGLLSLLGVRPSVIETARGVNLLYQYWIHTETIPKLGVLEEVLNTPSHHRAHHGSNRRYLDRNHGSILIVWDRLFGTFERESDDDPVVYGLTKNIDTFNPLRIATHEYVDILRDVAASTTWRYRLGFTFRGPGWAYERHAERTDLPEPTSAEAPYRDPVPAEVA